MKGNQAQHKVPKAGYALPAFAERKVLRGWLGMSDGL